MSNKDIWNAIWDLLRRRHVTLDESISDEAHNWLPYLAVLSASLLRESEEGKENKCAKRHQPLTKFKRDDISLIGAPFNSGVLVNLEIVPVRVAPADPRVNRSSSHVEIDAVRCDRNGTQELDGGQRHQSEVSIERKTRVGREIFIELRATTEEGA